MYANCTAALNAIILPNVTDAILCHSFECIGDPFLMTLLVIGLIVLVCILAAASSG
jgi:hypothetical protein